MMKLIISFFFLFFYVNANALEKYSWNSIDSKNFVNKLVKHDNEKHNFIYLGEVHSSYSLIVNDILVFSNLKNYSSFDSQFVSIEAVLKMDSMNKIELLVDNPLGRKQVKNFFIGDYYEVRIRALWDRFLRTGVTEASAFVLFIFTFVFFIINFITKDPKSILLSLYSFISCLYLISFTEIPRIYGNVVFLSGPLHFSLRLLQDMFLFIVFIKFLKNDKKFHFEYSVLGVYFLSIIIMLGSWRLSVSTKYDFYKNLMFLFAPLVAFPMLYGFLKSFAVRDQREKRLLVVICFALFLCQLNDLFVFWELISSYFTVKIYIPFVIMLITILYFRKGYERYSKEKKLISKSLVGMQIAHDIKSPISVLNVLKESVTYPDQGYRVLFDKTISRLNAISSNILADEVIHLNINTFLKDAIDEKTIENTNVEIVLENELVSDEYVLGNDIELKRIFSNLLNNAIEASESTKPHIKIDVKLEPDYVNISVVDDGKGFDQEVIRNLGTYGNTLNKSGGSGLGLAYAHNKISDMGGKFLIPEKKENGVVEIYLKRVKVQ